LKIFPPPKTKGSSIEKKKEKVKKVKKKKTLDPAWVVLEKTKNWSTLVWTKGTFTLGDRGFSVESPNIMLVI
jgi:hypothetical protein